MNTPLENKLSMVNSVCRWYALKVFYNKVFEMERYLKAVGVETYVPVRVIEKTIKGENSYFQKPAVSSLMFFRIEETSMKKVLEAIEGRALVYCRCGSKEPAPIPDREMQVFQLVTSGHQDHLEFFDGNVSKFCTGQRVRVVDGSFKGAEGYIKRIKGNRRLIVCIEGIVAVATSYIPSCMLEPIND